MLTSKTLHGGTLPRPIFWSRVVALVCAAAALLILVGAQSPPSCMAPKVTQAYESKKLAIALETKYLVESLDPEDDRVSAALSMHRIQMREAEATYQYALSLVQEQDSLVGCR
jgi:hypothetical protein